MIITLCGSARFEQNFIDANRELTLRGAIVFSMSVLPSQAGGKDWYTKSQKVMLDLAHLAKIQKSDAILVVGNGYIGFSTAREILWADMLGKLVILEAGADTTISSAAPSRWDRLYGDLLRGYTMLSIIEKAKLVLEKGE